MNERPTIMSLMGKKIKDIWLDDRGQIHFLFGKDQELLVSYSSVNDQNGERYRTDFVRFIGED